jgi:hypothetical protein
LDLLYNEMMLCRWLQGWVFLLSLLGMAPLAERLGFVTE